jgi:hypothetical protein
MLVMPEGPYHGLIIQITHRNLGEYNQYAAALVLPAYHILYAHIHD